MSTLAPVAPSKRGPIAKTYLAGNWETKLDTTLLQSVYDKQGWDGPMGVWRRRSVERLASRIAQLHAQLERPISVLDVACFSGDYYGKLSEVLPATSFTYRGVDVTPKYVENCLIRWANRDNVSFTVASALDLPFETNAFDIVFNSGMLIHIDDAPACVREFARVAFRALFVETTVELTQTDDFVDENKSGADFIDRVYSPAYARSLFKGIASIDRETMVPYGKHQSVLFEATPR